LGILETVRWFALDKFCILCYSYCKPNWVISLGASMDMMTNSIISLLSSALFEEMIYYLRREIKMIFKNYKDGNNR
jgi:hypothetical protein